jgi:hypothetical protein
MNSTPMWISAAAVAAATALAPARADTSLDTTAKPRAASTAPASGMRAKANASGLTLRYGVPSGVRAGQPVLVQLVISGARTSDASVQLSADSAALSILKIDGTTPSGPIALTPGAERRIDVEVSASSDGMHYLTAVLSQNGRRGATAVPLRVGTSSVSMKREGQAQTTPSGERIISLPSN